MKTRGTRFLVLAVVVFAAAALLMWFGQGEEALSASAQPTVEFPRKLRAQEKTRAQARRTWVVPTPDAGPQGASDPLLAALPRGKGKTAVVLEANALRHSPIGELLLECLYRDGGEQLKQLQERTGIDPLTDLDRLAITDEGLVLSRRGGAAVAHPQQRPTESRAVVRPTGVLPTRGPQGCGPGTRAAPGPCRRPCGWPGRT